MRAADRLVREQTGLGLVRALNEQRILEAILREGPASRARIASLTGLSKPTVSSVVRYLEAAGMVRQVGLVSGSIGRPSTLYEAVDRAGLVFAADVGGTKIRAGIADPYGEVVCETTEETSHDSGRALIDQIAALFLRLLSEADLERRVVWSAGIGIPGVFDPETEHVTAAPNLPAVMEIPMASSLSQILGIPVTIENDVNLAAVGERWRGLAKDRKHFVAISIGTGIGMGVVIDGEIYRGARGAAGEIDFLPLGVDRVDDLREHGPLEVATTGPAIVRRLHDRAVAEGRTPPAPSSGGVAEIFAAAEAGDPLALEVVDEEARIVATAIAAVAAVLDPELVVLGGGVGSNPALLGPVRAHVARMFPRQIEIGTSALGDAAAFYGAIAVALRGARQELVAQMAGARG